MVTPDRLTEIKLQIGKSFAATGCAGSSHGTSNECTDSADLSHDGISTSKNFLGFVQPVCIHTLLRRFRPLPAWLVFTQGVERSNLLSHHALRSSTRALSAHIMKPTLCLETFPSVVAGESQRPARVDGSRCSIDEKRQQMIDRARMIRRKTRMPCLLLFAITCK